MARDLPRNDGANLEGRQRRDKRDGLARGLAPTALFIVLVAACKHPSQAGDACPAAAIGQGRCVDASHRLSCVSYAWTTEPCRGPRGCYEAAAGKASCDQSVAIAGDACSTPAGAVCSADGQEVLACESAAMTVTRMCRGPRACSRDAAQASPSCDAGGAMAGDPCTKPGTSRCGTDGKSIYRCASGLRFELESACLGPRGCAEDDYFGKGPFGSGYLACDKGVLDVGSACGYPCPPGDHSCHPQTGWAYCSSDGTQLNTCHAGAVVMARRCPCKVDWYADPAGFTGSGFAVGCTPSAPGDPQWRSAALLSLAEPE